MVIGIYINLGGRGDWKGQHSHHRSQNHMDVNRSGHFNHARDAKTSPVDDDAPLPEDIWDLPSRDNGAAGSFANGKFTMDDELFSASNVRNQPVDTFWHHKVGLPPSRPMVI